MIFAEYSRGTEVYGPVPPTASAIAPHRGDVTTVRAAANVRLQAARRAETLRARVAPRGEAGILPPPAMAAE